MSLLQRLKARLQHLTWKRLTCHPKPSYIWVTCHMNNMSCELIWVKRGLSERCYVFFKVLANPTRLAVLEELRKRPRSVTGIAKTLKQEQSMISHNLEPLEKCRFVISERKAKQRIYSINKETAEPLFKLFDYHVRKYCPPRGTCLTEEGLRQLRKKEASRQLHVTHAWRWRWKNERW